MASLDSGIAAGLARTVAARAAIEKRAEKCIVEGLSLMDLLDFDPRGI